jgi:hypothetical protein
MSIGDEELMAYIDGELDAADRARVDAAVAADPVLAAKLATQRSLKSRLSAHFDTVLEEPLPRNLSELTAMKGTAGERRTGRRAWRWQEWSAMAATLVLGVLLGPFVMRQSQPLPFISANGRVVAIKDLENALFRQISGAASTEAGGIAIGMSFHASNGAYCRTFAMNPGPAGLACREWGEWVVEVLARNPRARQNANGEAYRQAGTAFPEAIRQAVEARIDGEPLSIEQENEVAARGWRETRQ